MAHFDFSILRKDIEKKIGYKLYSEYGEIAEEDMPSRNGNSITTPVVGVFRLNPVPLTALATPYIGVATGTIEIPAPIEKADEVCKKLDETASLYNATTEKGTNNGTMFTVVYAFETCAVGEKRRDVSLYNGEVVIITQTVTFTVIEQGITAYDTELFIDGIPVPFLRFEETRTAASEVTPNDIGNGEIAVTQEMYGITFDTPLVQNDLGDLLMDAIAEGGTNKAHVVEVARGGKRHFYLMAFGTMATTAIPPSNIGVSASMAEISPTAARVSDQFMVLPLGGEVVIVRSVNSAVFWGDGTSSWSNGNMIHVYSDSNNVYSRPVITFKYDQDRYSTAILSKNLLRKTVRLRDGMPIASLPVGDLVVSDKGDKISKTSDGTIEVTVGEFVTRISRQDRETLLEVLDPFVCQLRGYIANVNSFCFEYDTWAVTEEI